MRNWLMKKLRNQKGLTLIELLAVVVILGIIAAIAVPSIGGIIDNTKKDAHVANAQQMISSARLAVTSDSAARPATSGTKYLSLAWLVDQGYLETVRDPDGDAYIGGAVTAPPTAPVAGSHVEVTADSDNRYTYKVFTDNGTRGVRITVADDGSDTDDYVAEAAVNRDSVLK